MSDLAAALDFWHARLRIPVRLRLESRAELQTEPFDLVLVERASSVPDSALLRIAYEVEDLDGVAAELRRRGLDPRWSEEADASRSLSVQDPDGHSVDFVIPA